MKGPLILLIGVLLCAALVGLFWIGSRSMSVSITVTTNTPAAAPPPTTQALIGPPEVSSPRERPLPSEIVGIGAIVTSEPNTGALMIRGTMPNSPAAAAGLSGNLIIRKIDDATTEGMSIAECVKLLRGVAGTTVRLELLDVDANEVRTLELTRQKIQVQMSPPPTR